MPAIPTAPTAPETAAPSTPEPAPANDNVTPPPRPTEHELSLLIIAAASGDEVALAVLEPAVLAIARSSLVYLEDAERVARRVLFLFEMRRIGPPAPGRATAFLDAVVRYYADKDFRRTAARKHRREFEGVDRRSLEPEPEE
jgi:hypothetical protein